MRVRLVMIPKIVRMSFFWFFPTSQLNINNPQLFLLVIYNFWNFSLVKEDMELMEEDKLVPDLTGWSTTPNATPCGSVGRPKNPLMVS